MHLLRSLLLASAVTMLASPTLAQSCTDLCNPDWWKNTSDAEISAAVAKADVNARDENGFTALMFASSVGRKDHVKELLNAGADVNARNGNGWTALMGAALSGSFENVTVLLEAEADLTAHDEDGFTALMAAAQFGSSETVTALLEAGSYATARDDYGKTAFDYATQNDALKGAEVLSRLQNAQPDELVLARDALTEMRISVESYGDSAIYNVTFPLGASQEQLARAIPHIAVLAEVAQLDALDLNYTTVSDITALQGMTQLRTLFLSDTDVSDITALQGMTQLQDLDLSDTDVSDIAALQGMTQLRTLSLSRTDVSEVDIADLQAVLPNLNIQGP